MHDPTELPIDAGKDETVLIANAYSNRRYHRTLDGDTPICGTPTRKRDEFRDVDLVVVPTYDQCRRCTKMIEGTWGEISDSTR